MVHTRQYYIYKVFVRTQFRVDEWCNSLLVADLLNLLV